MDHEKGTRGKTLVDLAGIWQKQKFGSALSANFDTVSL